MSWLILTLDVEDHLKIVGIDSRKTSGLAHQLALKITDGGFRAKVVPPEDEDEVSYLYDQLMQKKEKGFIAEYGHVPNGTRSDGDGARTIGHMIYPAFGGMLEGVDVRARDSGDASALSTLPSTKIPSPVLKIIMKNYKSNTIGFDK